MRQATGLNRANLLDRDAITPVLPAVLALPAASHTARQQTVVSGDMLGRCPEPYRAARLQLLVDVMM